MTHDHLPIPERNDVFTRAIHRGAMLTLDTLIEAGFDDDAKLVGTMTNTIELLNELLYTALAGLTELANAAIDNGDVVTLNKVSDVFRAVAVAGDDMTPP